MLYSFNLCIMHFHKIFNLAKNWGITHMALQVKNKKPLRINQEDISVA